MNTSVLDIDKKGPEFIYIKYHIYRESVLRMKEEEAKVSKLIIFSL